MQEYNESNASKESTKKDTKEPKIPKKEKSKKRKKGKSILDNVMILIILMLNNQNLRMSKKVKLTPDKKGCCKG